MVVVLLTAGGAILLLRAYNALPDVTPPVTVIEKISQSMAVLASLCAAAFTTMAALRTFKPPSFSGVTGSLPVSHQPGQFGRPAGLLSGAAA